MPQIQFTLPRLGNDPWTPRINCFVLRQFEDQFNVPFTKAGELLCGGRIKPLIALAFYSVGEQADQRHVNFTQFEKAVETMHDLEAIGEAVGESLKLFIQATPSKETGVESAASGPGKTSTL